MTPAQLKSEQSFYRLGDKDFARLVGVGGDRTVRGWKQGRNAVPGPVVHLLAVLRDMPAAMRERTVARFLES